LVSFHFISPSLSFLPSFFFSQKTRKKKKKKQNKKIKKEGTKTKTKTEEIIKK